MTGEEIELVGIVAMAENGVIGKDGEMPWHIPADMRHFKATTTDHPVIMGRVTYESILGAIGEPLPDRTTIVLSSRELDTPESVVRATDLDDAIAAAQRIGHQRHDAERVFVAGGATVYEQFLPRLDRLIVTQIHDDPDGDTHFPSWDRSQWREVSRDERDGFAFVEYVRRSG